MSSSGVSKTVFSSPGQVEQGSEVGSSVVMSRLLFEHTVDQNHTFLQRDEHQKRLKTLRKELDYLQTTAWKYQPIEKYIGQ